MNRLLEHIPFQIVIGIITGCLLQHYLTIWKFDGYYLLYACILLLSIVFYSSYFKLKKTFWILSQVCFVFLGIVLIYLNNPKNKTNYFETVLKNDSYAILEIKKKLKPNKYNFKYYASVTQIDDQKTTGKILLYVQKDTSIHLKKGALIITKLKVKNIALSKNPSDFNYKQYLIKKGVYKQAFLKTKEFKILSKKSFDLLNYTEQFKNIIKIKIDNYNFSKDTKSITKALLLGDKTELPKKLQTQYIDAGVIHILAISGLHIGILIYVILFLLSPLNKLKNNTIYKFILTTLLLWAFAFFTGLSASTTRAITMFMFVSLGKLTNRKIPIEFSLVNAMFVLILFNPLYIFDLGFQLSFLAVFGIIWLQPLFTKLWNPKNKIINYFWTITNVSLSAQIAVLPISLFYFHQFPSLFLISNLVIIPFLKLILCLGIIIVVLLVSNIEVVFIFKSYDFIILKLNQFVNFISSFQKMILKNNDVSFVQMIGLYLIILFGINLYKQPNFKNYIYALSCVILIQITFISKQINAKNKKELIVHHSSKSTKITIEKNKKTLLFSNKKGENNQPIPSILKFKNEKIVILDSLGIYNCKKIDSSIIILTKSPKINLNRLIKTIRPKLIIADGSNYRNYVKRWQETCKHKKTPFHSTYDNGAYYLR